MTANTLEQRARSLIGDLRKYGTPECPERWRAKGHLTDMIADELEAALRLFTGSDWQPIETAPKGGEVDVWNGKRYADAAWAYPSYGRNDEACWCEQQYQHGYGWELSRIEPQPTHWQPLPAAPRHEPE